MDDLEETLNDSVRDSVLGRKKASAEATAAKKAAAERRRRQREEDQDAGRFYSLPACAALHSVQLLHQLLQPCVDRFNASQLHAPAPLTHAITSCPQCPGIDCLTACRSRVVWCHGSWALTAF